MLQVDNALTAAHNVLFSKGLDTAVATSRQQHAANVEAAHEAREAYLKKACSLLFLHSELCNLVDILPQTAITGVSPTRCVDMQSMGTLHLSHCSCGVLLWLCTC